jgi:hypothetical protein
MAAPGASAERCSAHRGEGDSAQRQIEIGGRADCGGIVATKLENGVRQALRQPGRKGATLGHRSGHRDERHARLINDDFSDPAPRGQVRLTSHRGRARLPPRSPQQHDPSLVAGLIRAGAKS